MCWKGREEGRGRIRETGSAVDRDRASHQGTRVGLGGSVMQRIPVEGEGGGARVQGGCTGSGSGQGQTHLNEENAVCLLIAMNSNNNN